jgi:hypothetical protein
VVAARWAMLVPVKSITQWLGLRNSHRLPPVLLLLASAARAHLRLFGAKRTNTILAQATRERERKRAHATTDKRCAVVNLLMGPAASVTATGTTGKRRTWVGEGSVGGRRERGWAKGVRAALKPAVRFVGGIASILGGEVERAAA